MDQIDKLFKLPIRVYDVKDIDESDRLEELTGKQSEIKDLDYAVAHIRLPIDEIYSYHDVWMRPYDIETVKEKGFNAVNVVTKTLGNYDVPWTVSKLESEMRKHFEKLKNGDKEEQKSGL